MLKKSRFFCVFVLAVSIGFAMSGPAKIFTPAANDSPAEVKTVFVGNDAVKMAAEKIYSGDFSAAKKCIESADANNRPEALSALSAIISEYERIDTARKGAKAKALEEKLAELAKMEAEAEVNEPNLLDVFPVIIKAREFASDEQKSELMADAFVQKIIQKARTFGTEYESKGQWLDSLLYGYSWLGAVYEDDKTIKDKKKEIEDKIIIKSSLTDNPCETITDRFQKIRPKMFTRGLDVLEYGYVEPFSYGQMAAEAIKRFRQLAEVLHFSDPNDENFTVEFSRDKLGDFAAALEAFGAEYADGPVGMSKDKFLKLFEDIIAVNAGTINLSKEIVISQFAEASLSALDPHTVLVWPKQTEDFEKNMTNEFTGIGVEISKRDGQLKAVSLLPGTPAYSSGIDAGDIIENVDGEPTKDMSVTCAVSKITGPAGTKVKLTVRNPEAEQRREIEITRAKIIVPTTRGWSRAQNSKWKYFVDDKDKIGYVRVTNFSGTTAADLGKTLKKLEGEGMKALVLDLRFNTGGYLQSAAAIVDMFVKKGIIVSSQPRVGLPNWEAAHKRGTHPNYPVVVLINSGSASASEIVAGALADKTYNRATLVGEQSYGKGSVQTITDYPGGGAQMKYTMAYYHLPDGSKVKSRYAIEKLGKTDWGILPNVEIKLRSDELKTLFEYQRDNEILAAANHDDVKDKLVRHSLKETLASDSQLEIAVLVAKTKLIESGLQK